MDTIVIDWSPLEGMDAMDERVRNMLPHERLAEASRMLNDKRHDVADPIRRARPNWTADQIERENRWAWFTRGEFDEHAQATVRELIRPPSLGYE